MTWRCLANIHIESASVQDIQTCKRTAIHITFQFPRLIT